MTTGQHLNQIETAGLIQVAQMEPELEYIFRHALIQEAAYGLMVKGQRQELHAAVARALENLYGDRLDEMAPLLAHHFDQAGNNEQALKYLTLAGDQAASRYAHAEAVMHYRRAIDVAGQVQADSNMLRHLYLSQGRTHQLSGEHDEALSTYLGLELVARERGDKPLELEALMAQATVYAMLTQQANPAESIRLSEQALMIARKVADEPAEAKILWNLSLAHWRKMDIPVALGYAEQSIEIARRLNLREQMAYTLHDMGRYLMILGRLDDAAQMQQEAEALWRELGNLPMLADSLNLRAPILYSKSDYSGAHAASDEALTLSRDSGNWWGQAMSLRALSVQSLESGEITLALETAFAAMEASDQAGFVLGSLAGRGMVIDLYEYVGQPVRANEMRANLARLAQDSSDPFVQGAFALTNALIAQRNGDPEPARIILDVSRQWPRMGPPHVPQFIDLRRVEIAFQLRDYEETVRIVAPLSLVSNTQTPKTESTQLARYKARSLIALGRLTEAREAFEQAFLLVSDDSVRFQRWENLAALADLEDAEGNHETALVHRAKAREAIEYLAARMGNPEFDASFRARPEVAALLAESNK